MNGEERKKLILEMRSEGRSFQEIADRFGVSRQCIHQIINPPKKFYKKGYSKTEGGILLESEDYKSYTDYLQASSYKKEYKQFCINWYNGHKRSEIVNDEIE